MGGEGPAVRLSQDSTTISFWANRTGLKLFDSQQQEEVYSKAREFFLERGLTLIADYGWQEDTENTTVSCQIQSEPFFLTDKYKSMLHLSKAGINLVLPAAFTSLLEPSEADKWSEMFRCTFHAKRDRMNNSSLIIDSPTPLSDIFYLLQTLLPGMLLIYRIDEIDDCGEQERTRALPPAPWVELHKEMLQTIFGDSERYGCLLAAAADRGLEENVEMISSYGSYYDDYDSDFYTNSYGQREIKDFTACDKECGYCGTCDY